MNLSAGKEFIVLQQFSPHNRIGAGLIERGVVRFRNQRLQHHRNKFVQLHLPGSASLS